MKSKWVWENSHSWRIGTEFIKIDDYEDCEAHDPDECLCCEVWVGDDSSGNWDCEGIFDSYEEAKRYAEKFMRENPNGWMLKDRIKADYDDRVRIEFT